MLLTFLMFVKSNKNKKKQPQNINIIKTMSIFANMSVKRVCLCKEDRKELLLFFVGVFQNLTLTDYGGCDWQIMFGNNDRNEK